MRPHTSPSKLMPPARVPHSFPRPGKRAPRMRANQTLVRPGCFARVDPNRGVRRATASLSPSHPARHSALLCRASSSRRLVRFASGNFCTTWLAFNAPLSGGSCSDCRQSERGDHPPKGTTRVFTVASPADVAQPHAWIGHT